MVIVDCELNPDAALTILWPIFFVLVVAAIGGWIALRSPDGINRDGEGLFDLWSDENPRVRRLARAAVIGVVGMFVLYIAVDRSVWLYHVLTDFVSTCASVPALWTPSIIFTIASIFLPFVGLFVKVPKLGSVVWALLTLAVGFHLSTWNAPSFAIVWVPVALAALPIVVALLWGADKHENGTANTQSDATED